MLGWPGLMNSGCRGLDTLLMLGWLGLMNSARVDNCPSGQRRGPTTARDDEFPSPDHSASVNI